jgi:hypothetical protein
MVYGDGHGTVLYVVVEDQRRVDVLDLWWI